MRKPPFSFLGFFLALITFAIPAWAVPVNSTLTVYAYPASKQLNWSSPRSILKSFIKIGLQKKSSDHADVHHVSDFGDRGTMSHEYISTMGHTIGHISCSLPGGERYDRWTSFSGQDYSEVDNRLLFKEARGMGALFYDFVDGHIISGEENWKRLVHYKSRLGSPRYIQFELNASQCRKLKDMVQFFESFHFKPGTPLADLEMRPPGNTLYFNTMDPYETYIRRQKGEENPVGGGCAPYGAALIKRAGFYSPAFEKSWRWKLDVSEKLIGGPETGRRVGAGDILLSSLGGSWAHEGYSNREIWFYDPARIWSFIGEVMSCIAAEGQCSGPAAEWISEHRGKVQRGAPHRFSDSYAEKDENMPTQTRDAVSNVELDGVILTR